MATSSRSIGSLATIHVGDCLEVLRGMPDCSVDSVVTDPPYGLSDHKPADIAEARIRHAVTLMQEAGATHEPPQQADLFGRAA